MARRLAVIFVFVAILALVVNALGAISQEREGGRGRGFPEWLYTLSGVVFLGAVTCAIVLVCALIIRRLTR